MKLKSEDVRTLRMLFVASRNSLFRCTTVCLKNDTDVALYNSNAHKPILAMFGRDVA